MPNTKLAAAGITENLGGCQVEERTVGEEQVVNRILDLAESEEIACMLPLHTRLYGPWEVKPFLHHDLLNLAHDIHLKVPLGDGLKKPDNL
jgi:hypothetical protein